MEALVMASSYAQTEKVLRQINELQKVINMDTDDESDADENASYGNEALTSTSDFMRSKEVNVHKDHEFGSTSGHINDGDKNLSRQTIGLDSHDNGGDPTMKVYIVILLNISKKY